MRRKGSRLNIHQLCMRLSNPRVIGVSQDEMILYRLDDSIIGRLYAATISDLEPHESYALALADNPELPNMRQLHYQREVQRSTRYVMAQMLGALTLGKTNAAEVAQALEEFRIDRNFAQRTLEGNVQDLAKEKKFEEITSKLRLGAKNFHRERRQYQFALSFEYKLLLKAFE